jgi:hypothetical protein
MTDLDLSGYLDVIGATLIDTWGWCLLLRPAGRRVRGDIAWTVGLLEEEIYELSC